MCSEMSNGRYILAIGYEELGEGRDPWPYRIEFDPGRTEKPFALSEGYGYNAAGGFFSHLEILEGDWEKHFSMTSAGWLMKLFEEFRDQSDIDVEAVFDAYELVHNERPILSQS